MKTTSLKLAVFVLTVTLAHPVISLAGMATGEKARATGVDSTATGQNANASGDHSTATGANSNSSGWLAPVTGTKADASGFASTATGSNSKASGTRSTANGDYAQASGDNSTAIGSQAKATGKNTVAIGSDSVADRDNTVSVGQKGAERQVTNATVNTKKTTPPPLFTEASLLAALVRVADFVTDTKIKTLLKTKDKDKKDEHGGIGTPATRHSMIEKLKAREFIVLDKRNLIPTQKGLDFFQALPDIATNPDMTALWAEKQEQIEQGNLTVDAFVEQLYGDINHLLSDDIGQNLKIDTPNNSSDRIRYVLP
ncbi:DNA topoisomerase [Arsenophonus sp.]|uniref:DNA topoisomerase n=1 Tax=Arsenophonus sp. TaxID=1872640 RepID=UPI0028547379|nr:DNA topoisomerase [Arsenophonus sp.]MDR5615152.1 DNA topoisomerase [Arsenophonus sp.]